MPVNLPVNDTCALIAGVKLAGTAAGLKKNGALDLVLVELSEQTRVAAVFTRNAFCAAPVTIARRHMQASSGEIRALLINSGGANAATGELGIYNARANCAQVARLLDIAETSVLPFSTGVIGEQLAMSAMQQGIDTAAASLSNDQQSWNNAAQGILTTDIVPKLMTRSVEIGGQTISFSGFAKGSGMIQPNMATMLAYVFTDAAVSAEDCHAALVPAVEKTFNSVSVDGDTSTNDSCVLSATAASGVQLDPNHPDWALFCEELTAVCLWLAQSLVRDGEGASKFITVNVTGGASGRDCQQVGLTIGNSPLVKTAFFASDANLGRIIMAVGRSGVDGLDINTLSLQLDDVPILDKGQPHPDYTDAAGQAVMANDEITMTIDLGMGAANWTCWTCDLSHEYVSINADYRS